MIPATTSGEGEAFYEHALRRIGRLCWLIAGAGVAVCTLLAGPAAGVSFAAGAAFGGLNYRWLKGLATRLAATATGLRGDGRPGDPPPRPAHGGAAFAALMGLRYLILGAAAYATVKILGADLRPLLVGVFVPVAAVLFEIIFELFAYART